MKVFSNVYLFIYFKRVLPSATEFNNTYTSHVHNVLYLDKLKR